MSNNPDIPVSYFSILESVKAAIIVSDLSGKIFFVNKSAEKLFGYEPDELLGQDIIIIFPNDLAHNRKNLVESIMWGEQVDNYETERIDKNKNTLYVSVNLTPLTDEKGNLIGITKVIRNITDKKRSEGKFQALLESAPDAMVIVNREGNIQLVNAQTEKLFDYKRDELIGQKVEILIPDRYRGVHTPHRKGFFSEPRTRAMGVGLELYGRKKNGEEFPVEISLSPIETEDGMLVSSAIRDITDQKRAAGELREYASRLENSNKELEQFAYVASHDLQEPLRKIQTLAGMIRGKETLSEKGLLYFSMMQKSASRMQQLIVDLLDFSRLSSAEKKFETIHLHKIIEEVISNFNDQIDEKNAIIEFNKLCEVSVIDFQFRQLIHNLISNSLKFSKPDVPPHIVITGEIIQSNNLNFENITHETYCHISVKDNGIGFEKESSENIFEVFKRLHTKEKYPGTGIGLATVKKIVANHQGLITTTSEPNKGTTFDIYIPST